ncbi:hypothetical protein Rxyl_2035 [Rubrobacter xylanophilus DSM 9941]|uniref:Uncharacterized protein n=1 Tax=Rubrobacter xylanophilus (strain DSM 9941 / JCM 11954 / NBRC 16129 / PRD-1) TaxID=266117 RepID=Q1AUE7_RUBXD|nr:hypothetical protein Rxyl_2035 [Rubrobacter xylanophilus DSM 9941]
MNFSRQLILFGALREHLNRQAGVAPSTKRLIARCVITYVRKRNPRNRSVSPPLTQNNSTLWRSCTASHASHALGGYVQMVLLAA